jgi:hypothetical protein
MAVPGMRRIERAAEQADAFQGRTWPVPVTRVL